MHISQLMRGPGFAQNDKPDKFYIKINKVHGLRLMHSTCQSSLTVSFTTCDCWLHLKYRIIHSHKKCKAHDRRPKFSVQETRTRNSHEKLRSYVTHSHTSFFSCEKLVPSWSQLYSVHVSRASFSYEFLGRRTWVVCHGLNSFEYRLIKQAAIEA